ncbi:MAG: hypothetical protein WBD07_17255 [Vicinamibacterales bacterium]
MSSPVIAVPGPAALPDGRGFSREFLRLRELALDWIHAYYDVDHLRRTGDWLLALDPEAAEPLVIAALTHDMERTVPGGPLLDKVNTAWDDPVYNTAHCTRSAEVVTTWLVAQGASDRFVRGIHQPILEHEFGGSPEGDLMQAADSISFLETNRVLVARWVAGHECSLEKGRDKLRWMCDRVRLERARDIARVQFEQAMADVDERLGF